MPLPMPLQMIQPMQEQGLCILFGLPNIVFKSIEKKYEALGQQVFNIESNFFDGIDNVVMLEQKAIEAIALAQQINTSISSFIFYYPNVGDNVLQAETYLKLAFLFAKHLKKPFETNGKHSRNQFLVITSVDGRLGFSGKKASGYYGLSLAGLCKCLQLEWPRTLARLIDFSPEIKENKLADYLFEEWLDADQRWTEIGRSVKHRMTLSAETDIIPYVGDNKNVSVNAQDVFLVTGGAKGITADCLVAMAKAFACKFVLLGRTILGVPLDIATPYIADEKQLKNNILIELKKQGGDVSLKNVKKIYQQIEAEYTINHTLSLLKDAGSDALYFTADVSQPVDLSSIITQAAKTLGPITGLIHGAGVLADKLIHEKTINDFEAVFSVKWNGLLHVLSQVDKTTLKKLILFSSVAGFYGNIGQSDYAIANELMNKYALVLNQQYPKLQVKAINWGAWEGGMVSDFLLKKFKEAGVILVDRIGGPAMLVQECASMYDNDCQVIIGGTLPKVQPNDLYFQKQYCIKKTISLPQNTFLEHHTIQGNAVLPMVVAFDWMYETALHVYKDFYLDFSKDFRLLNGIIVNKDAIDYFIEINEIENKGTRIIIDIKLYSKTGKLPRYHYAAQFVLSHYSITSNKTLPAMHKLNAPAQSFDCSTLYTDGTLFHGTYYQGIKAITNLSDNNISLQCKAPNVPLANQGQFPIQQLNTFLLDTLFQALLVWVHHFKNGAKCLPVSFEHCVIYKIFPIEKQMNVSLHILEATDYRVTSNILIYDDVGEVYIELQQAKGTISKDLVW